MDRWSSWLVATAVIVAVLGFGLILRKARIAQLERGELTDAEVDFARVQLLEFVQRHSYTLGRWVDLSTFWKQRRIRRDGDRWRVLAPLLAEAVLLVEVPQDRVQRVVERAMDWLFLDLPKKVVLPELVFRRMYQGEPLVIGSVQVEGDWVMGSQDKGMNFGPRVGGDVVGGDKVGHDKAGRDTRGVHAGGAVSHSGNTNSSVSGSATIETPDDLAEALSRLAAQAEQRGTSQSAIEALRWAAIAACTSEPPEPRDAVRMQRVCSTEQTAGCVIG